MKKLSFILLLLLSTLCFGEEKTPRLPTSDYPSLAPDVPKILAPNLDIRRSEKKWKTSIQLQLTKHYPESEEIEKIKKEKFALKQEWEQTHKIPNEENQSLKKTQADLPYTLGTGFKANRLSKSTPPDNHIAISHSGYIVSVDNDGYSSYNTSGTAIELEEEWTDFINSSSLTSKIYDPRVIYDDVAKRFIMVILHGSSSSTSKIVVAYSKAENPSSGWNFYTLDGDLRDEGLWFDYPTIGQSSKDLYITGNLFSNSGNFSKSVIIQLPKLAGFNGQSLSYRLFNDVKTADNTSASSIVPLSYGGDGLAGPGIILASTRSSGSSTVYYYQITDDASGSPVLNAYKSSLNRSYAPAGNASQKGTSNVLNTGDSRSQAGFMINGYAQVILNSSNDQGYGEIMIIRTNLSNLSSQTAILGLSGYDYCFPSMASFTTSKSDLASVICFLRSASDIYPQIRTISMSHEFDWLSTGSKLVQDGESYVDILTGSTERWGDYTGVCRKPNSIPEAWMVGGYANSINGYRAFIQQVTGSNINVSIEQNTNPQHHTKLYPNPVVDIFTLDIQLQQYGNVSVEIVDVNGKWIKTLYTDALPMGNHAISFNKNALSQGTYLVTVKQNGNLHSSTRLIIQ